MKTHLTHERTPSTHAPARRRPRNAQAWLLSLLVMLGAFSVLLAGCGGDPGGNTGKDTGPTGPIPTPTFTPIPQPVTKQYGPFSVVGGDVHTGVTVLAGDTVRVTSDGLVDFGGGVGGIGAPKLNADGDTAATPTDYPAPALRKNSLICKVGAIWYQGGMDRTFHPTESGELILRTNDRQVEDNTQGWNVTVYVTH
jgi:hypothetical protein